MNSLLIHLSGYLSAEMGSELYLKVKETSQTPTLFCLECSELVSMDPVGAEYLKKISSRVRGTASKVALTGCQSSLKEAFTVNQVADLFPIFLTEREAKAFLETQSLPTEPANVSQQQMQSPEISTVKFIHCPVCEQSLKFTSVGDHLCPNCHNKFSVNKRGWTSLYEKLV